MRPLLIILAFAFVARAHDSPEHKVEELSFEMARSGKSADLFIQRAIEHRALEKLRNHPKLIQFWKEYLTGEPSDNPPVNENRQAELTPDEIAALFCLAQTQEERHALAKLLRRL